MLRTIHIMWLREVKKYIRSRSRIVATLIQPVFYLLALGYGLGANFKPAGQGDYFDFLVPGIIGMSIIFPAISNGLGIVWDRQFGFLKETLVAPVPRLAIILGRTLGGATVTTAQGCALLVVALVLGFEPYSWPLIIAAVPIMLLVATLFSAFGIAIASHFSDMQGFQLIVSLLVFPMFLLSGALFPLHDVPNLLLWLASLDPLSYGVDALRMLLSGATHFGLALDLSVLLVTTMICLSAGSYFFSRIET